MTLPLGARRARLLAVLSGLLLAVAWPTAAFGHASATGSTPADGQVLTTAPERLTVTFTEPVRLGDADNALLDASGVRQAATFEVDGTVLTIRPERPLGTGTHVVSWRVVSADSHPVTGGFTFAVGEATPGAISVPTSQPQRELGVARAVLEGLRFAGVLGLAGLGAFWQLVAPAAARRDPTVVRRALGAGRVLGVLAVAATLLLAPVTALSESGGALASVAAPGTWRDGLAGAPGMAVLLALGGVVAIAVGRVRSTAVVPGVGVALLLTSLLPVGHTRSYGPSWLVPAADLVHVGAGAVWWGGLIGLVIVLAAPRLRTRDRATTVARFSGLAAVVLVALLVAGIVLYWRISGSFAALVETGYGRAVLVKSALFVPVVAVAAWNRWFLLGRLEGREADDATEVLRRTVGFEALALAAVLVTTGVLVGQAPPPRPGAVATSVPVDPKGAPRLQGSLESAGARAADLPLPGASRD